MCFFLSTVCCATIYVILNGDVKSSHSLYEGVYIFNGNLNDRDQWTKVEGDKSIWYNRGTDFFGIGPTGGVMDLTSFSALDSNCPSNIDWHYFNDTSYKFLVPTNDLQLKCVECPKAHAIGNGKCDPENINAKCLFDQGDCCNETLIRNKVCDHANNFTQCGFDGGDCCDNSLVGNGICDVFNDFTNCENHDGGDCRLDKITDWPKCPYNPEYIGDGICHDHLRNAYCNYDGNDCEGHEGTVAL